MCNLKLCFLAITLNVFRTEDTVNVAGRIHKDFCAFLTGTQSARGNGNFSLSPILIPVRHIMGLSANLSKGSVTRLASGSVRVLETAFVRDRAE